MPFLLLRVKSVALFPQADISAFVGPRVIFVAAQRRGAVDPVRSSVLTHHNYGHSACKTHDGSKYLQVLLDIHIIIIIRRQRLKCADMGMPIHIQAHSRAYSHTCMHTCLRAMLLKERFVKIGFQGRFERANRGSKHIGQKLGVGTR